MRIVKSEADEGKTGHLNITWYYNEKEEATRAEQDKNGDGMPDIWYFYHQGMVSRLEEDTNADGKADLWEDYDDAEALIRRSRDIDHDGIADIVEESEDQTISSNRANNEKKL